MFLFNPHFYYPSILLQLICGIHCLVRNRRPNWIWLILFLPVIGPIAYLVTELHGSDMSQMQAGLGSIFNPSGRIKRLEENLRFNNSFGNRIALADAYLAAGETERAVELYESSLTGAFEENEHVQACLMIAYYKQGRYEEVLRYGKKIVRLPQFNRTHIHILYAIALDHMGHSAEAGKEFGLMKGRYANFEARYQYGLFLIRQDRDAEAFQLYRDILDEWRHLSPRERRANRVWVGKVREELKRGTVAAKAV